MIENQSLYRGKYCLELGAGSALPSLVAASGGACYCVVSDYPAENVIENIQELIKVNKLSNAIGMSHIWGEENVQPLLNIISNHRSSSDETGYDVIFMAELLWKDTYHLHRHLLESISLCLHPNGIAYAAFAHRPTADDPLTDPTIHSSSHSVHTLQHDLEFFELAQHEFGFECSLLQIVRKYCDVGGDGSLIDVKIYRMSHSKG